jgi:C4-dicarboxylate-specific signal transduction histidine kinase
MVTLNMNLRTSIITLSFLGILAVAIGGYFAYAALEKTTINDVRRKAEDQTKEIATRIDLVIVENQRAVMALARQNELTEALAGRNPDTLSKANRILDLFHHSLDVSVCYLMDSKGTTIASSNRSESASFVGKNYSFRPYFKEAIDGSATVYMALGVTSNKRGVYFSYPVYGKEKDKPLGVAVMKTTIDTITDELSESYDGIMTVIDPHGLIFISTDEEMLYKSLWKLPEDAIQEIADAKQFGEGPWSWTGITRRADNHAIDTSGNEYYIHEVDIHRHSGWKVVYLHDQEASAIRISAPILKNAGTLIAGLLLIALLSVFMLYKKASEVEERLRNIS